MDFDDCCVVFFGLCFPFFEGLEMILTMGREVFLMERKHFYDRCVEPFVGICFGNFYGSSDVKPGRVGAGIGREVII